MEFGEKVHKMKILNLGHSWCSPLSLYLLCFVYDITDYKVQKLSVSLSCSTCNMDFVKVKKRKRKFEFPLRNVKKCTSLMWPLCSWLTEVQWPCLVWLLLSFSPCSVPILFMILLTPVISFARIFFLQKNCSCLTNSNIV